MKHVHRPRIKACDRCTQVATVLYRVQYDASQTWRFVCPTCWPQIAHDNVWYTYGGTWKAQPKKR